MAELAECRLAMKQSLEMGICSSASTWVDCGLVGMLFLFYVNLSFSAVNILKKASGSEGLQKLGTVSFMPSPALT